MDDAAPRSKLSLWLLGLLLGPVVLMLWLGRGRLALVYLLVALIFVGAIFLTVGTGFAAPPAFADFDVMGLLLSLPFHIVGLIHGLMLRETSLRRPWFSRWYAAIVLSLAANWLIPIIVRDCLYQPFNAPSASMIPSLAVGDHFFVSKTAYGYSRFSFTLGLAAFPGRVWAGEPKRGDIVVFKLPRDNETDYLKRLIGLPGDRIQMKDGMVYLNDKALPLTRVQGIPCIEGERCNFFRETLPDGRSYVINNATPNGAADNTDEYVVPEGHYFMLGDNRDNSLDSRYGEPGGIGYIPYENLIGPAVLIFWNSIGVRIDDRLQGYPGR